MKNDLGLNLLSFPLGQRSNITETEKRIVVIEKSKNLRCFKEIKETNYYFNKV